METDICNQVQMYHCLNHANIDISKVCAVLSITQTLPVKFSDVVFLVGGAVESGAWLAAYLYRADVGLRPSITSLLVNRIPSSRCSTRPRIASQSE